MTLKIAKQTGYRKCTDCKVEFKLNGDNFVCRKRLRRDGASRNEYSARCKPCYNKNQRQYSNKGYVHTAGRNGNQLPIIHTGFTGINRLFFSAIPPTPLSRTLRALRREARTL